MNLLKTIFREVFGLFVDDGSFAVLIVAWIAVTWVLSFKVLSNPAWGALILFCGLAATLLGSAASRAGRSN
jgi:hypothetical protein